MTNPYIVSSFVNLYGDQKEKKKKKNTHWWNDQFLETVLWENQIDIYIGKVGVYVASYIYNVNQKWIKDLKVRPESILEGNLSVIFQVTEMNKDFSLINLKKYRKKSKTRQLRLS